MEIHGEEAASILERGLGELLNLGLEEDSPALVSVRHELVVFEHSVEAELCLLEKANENATLNLRRHSGRDIREADDSCNERPAVTEPLQHPGQLLNELLMSWTCCVPHPASTKLHHEELCSMLLEAPGSDNSFQCHSTCRGETLQPVQGFCSSSCGAAGEDPIAQELLHAEQVHCTRQTTLCLTSDDAYLAREGVPLSQSSRALAGASSRRFRAKRFRSGTAGRRRSNASSRQRANSTSCQSIDINSSDTSHSVVGHADRQNMLRAFSGQPTTYNGSSLADTNEIAAERAAVHSSVADASECIDVHQPKRLAEMSTKNSSIKPAAPLYKVLLRTSCALWQKGDLVEFQEGPKPYGRRWISGIVAYSWFDDACAWEGYAIQLLLSADPENSLVRRVPANRVRAVGGTHPLASDAHLVSEGAIIAARQVATTVQIGSPPNHARRRRAPPNRDCTNDFSPPRLKRRRTTLDPQILRIPRSASPTICFRLLQSTTNALTDSIKETENCRGSESHGHSGIGS